MKNMYYDITSFTFEDDQFALENIELNRHLFDKIESNRIDLINFGNRNGIFIARYATHDAFLRGRAVSQQIFGTLVGNQAVDIDTLQWHEGQAFITL